MFIICDVVNKTRILLTKQKDGKKQLIKCLTISRNAENIRNRDKNAEIS